MESAMHVKIIDVIEVTDYVDDAPIVEGEARPLRERKRYYLRDGAPLELADPFKPEPAMSGSFTVQAGDPNIYRTN